MNRWIFAAFAVGVVTVIAAPGCANTGVGDPCTPDAEYDPLFPGFEVGEVSVESKSFVCLSRLCLVNHFQGRVSCPYGQVKNPTGAVPPFVNPTGNMSTPGGPGCFVPGTQSGDSGTCTLPPADGTCEIGVAVPAQITGTGAGDRTANKAVYCSCRCANIDGQTNDGANYCSCPDGFTCQQLVSSIGLGTNQELTGAYCIKSGTAYSATSTDTTDLCDATVSSKSANAGQAGYCPQQF